METAGYVCKCVCGFFYDDEPQDFVVELTEESFVYGNEDVVITHLTTNG